MRRELRLDQAGMYQEDFCSYTSVHRRIRSPDWTRRWWHGPLALPWCYRTPQVLVDIYIAKLEKMKVVRNTHFIPVVTDHLRSQLEMYVATWEKAVMVLTVRPIPVVTDHSCCYRSPEGPTARVRSQAGEGEGGADQTEGGTHQSQTAGFLQCHGGGGHLPRFTLRVH